MLIAETFENFFVFYKTVTGFDHCNFPSKRKEKLLRE